VVGRKPGKRGRQTSGVTGIVWVGQTGEQLGAKGWELEEWGARSLWLVSHGRARQVVSGDEWIRGLDK